jgi:uncharacterized protein YggE
MTPRMKQKCWAATLAAVLVFAAWRAASGQEVMPAPAPRADASAVPTLTVTGHGEVNAKPDKATVGLAVEGQADTATAAQQTVNAAMQKVLAALQKVGIPERSIQTSGLNLSPIYASQKPGQESEPPRTVGYRASNTLQVEATDLQLVGQIIDAATTAGANRVEGISFGLDNDLNYRTDALRAAAAEAKAKAATLADALGLKLVSVRSVSQVAMNSPRPLYAYASLGRAAMAATPVEPGQIKIEASVTVEYQIEPAGAGKKPAER